MGLTLILLAALSAAPDSLALASVSAQSDAPKLRLHVVDATGGVIVGASVHVVGGPPTASSERRATTDAAGLVDIPLVPGVRYTLEIEAPGFDKYELRVAAPRSGNVERRVTLQVSRLVQNVTVRPAAREAAIDLRGNAFATILTPEQIAALPDDPEEVARALAEMAGPGARIRVDGLHLARIPPKADIERVRIAWAEFSAEFHEAGGSIVDITTKTGRDRLAFLAVASVRDRRLDAKPAFAPQRTAEGDRAGLFNVSGPFITRDAAFSLLGSFRTHDQAAPTRAVLPNGLFEGVARQTEHRMTAAGRISASVANHSLRAGVDWAETSGSNLGTGGLNLPEHAYALSHHEVHAWLSLAGTLGKHLYNELRVERTGQARRTSPLMDRPALVVSGAFVTGGAQQDGTGLSRDWAISDDMDAVVGRHAIRTGAVFEREALKTTDLTNRLGTFTFPDLASYQAQRPTTFVQRVGDGALALSQSRAAIYVQDDVRVSAPLMLNLGLRVEGQNRAASAANVAPRLGITWVPSPGGATTIRAGGGLYYGWVDADVYEEILRVNGTRQADVVVLNPGFPDAFASGSSHEEAVARRYETDAALPLARFVRVSAAVSTKAGRWGTLTVTAQQLRGTNQLGASGAGTAGSAIDTIRISADRQSLLRSLTVTATGTLPWRNTVLIANYTLAKATGDADGPFVLPADGRTVAAEWGPSTSDVRHRGTASVTTRMLSNLWSTWTVMASSAMPFTITTGRDENADGLVTDRPPGVGRNSARGAPQVTWSAQVSWNVRERAAERGNVSAGAKAGANVGRASRTTVRLFVRAQNVFNRLNPVAFCGVLSSPLFGQPVAALPTRQLELGGSVGF